MKAKMIITAAFAALTLGTASWAMADDNGSVCQCGSAYQTELEKKAKEADKYAEEADKHAKDVDVDESATEEEKQKAHDDKDKADAEKAKADKEAKDEEASKVSASGACICPDGTPSSYGPGSANGSANGSAAFREVRGQ